MPEVVMGRVQVFDVNETLLDLAGLDPHFQRVFGDAGMRRVWFAQMIQFVARPGKVLDPLVEAPDVVGADLSEVADRIIAADGGRR